MLEIHTKTVIDEDKNPIAVQIPIEEFKRLEEIIANYGLSRLINEVKEDERLSGEDAREYYNGQNENYYLSTDRPA